MPRGPFPNNHNYAVIQEQLRGDDAVTWYGEPTVWVAWWGVRDYEAQLVDRCPTCFKDIEIAEAYGQGTTSFCSDCYGTTFEGGVRFIICRPGLWSHSHQSESQRKEGVTELNTAKIQGLSSFGMRDNDMAIRADGTRWRLSQPNPTEMTTGFGYSASESLHITNIVSAQMMDKAAVGYLLTIDLSSLTDQGWHPGDNYQTHALDNIVGPLFPV